MRPITRAATLIASLIGTVALAATSSPAATAALAEPTPAARAAESVTLKDAKDSKAMLDIRKVHIYGGNDMLSAEVTYKASDYANDFPEIVDFAAWFDTDGDKTPEYRLRADDDTLYKVKNWKPFGGKAITGDCFSNWQGFSATSIEAMIPLDCLPSAPEKFRVHVRTFFTGDQPYPEGTDNAPNATKGWSKAVTVG